MQSHLTARLAAGLLFVSTLITPTMAAYGIVDTDGSDLQVRSQASAKSSTVFQVPEGTVLDIVEPVCDGTWYKVIHKGISGYVSAQMLLVVEDNTPQPAMEAPAAKPAAEAPAPKAAAEPRYVKVNTVSSSLNVRSGPSTSASKVGSLYNGQVVEVLSESNGWLKIAQGYISAEFTVPTSKEASAPSSSLGQEIANYARTLVGCPYVYGGSSPRGFDCSGLTSYVYGHFGYTLNRSSSGQLDNGTPVSRSELQPGDLVMFKDGGGSRRATHVGVYIGGNQFVHASTSRVGVIVSSLSEAYYASTYVGARHVI